jgi:hypothetical protein
MRFNNNVRTTLLTFSFILSVQSHGYYSHFTLLSTLHGAYQTVTHVPPVGPSALLTPPRSFSVCSLKALHPRVFETFAMGLVPAFLPEIKGHGG